MWFSEIDLDVMVEKTWDSFCIVLLCEDLEIGKLRLLPRLALSHSLKLEKSFGLSKTGLKERSLLEWRGAWRQLRDS